MGNKIKIGIVGYGNIGRGVEYALNQSSDMELVGVFTRRSPESLSIRTPGAKAYHVSEVEVGGTDGAICWVLTDMWP